MGWKSVIIGLVAVLIGAACGTEDSPLAPDAIPTKRSPSSSAGLAPGASAQVADDFPFKKILCFGDSITFGVTLQTPQILEGAQTELAIVEGYVPKLWRRLEERYGTGIQLVNAGIGGENTTEGAERIRYEMAVHDPDLVLLLEGIVDVNNPLPRFPVVRDNLAAMMDLVLRQGRTVVIGTYPLLNSEGFRTSGAENIPRLNRVIRQEANRQSVPIADHEATAEGDFSGQGPDGLHPNDIGYDSIAETWFQTIVELVEGEEPT